MKKIKLLTGLAGIAGLTAVVTPIMAGCSCNKDKTTAVTKADFVAKVTEWTNNSFCATTDEFPIGDIEFKVGGTAQEKKKITYTGSGSERQCSISYWYAHPLAPQWVDCSIAGSNILSYEEKLKDETVAGVTYKITDEYASYSFTNAEKTDSIKEITINKFGYVTELNIYFSDDFYKAEITYPTSPYSVSTMEYGNEQYLSEDEVQPNTNHIFKIILDGGLTNPNYMMFGGSQPTFTNACVSLNGEKINHEVTADNAIKWTLESTPSANDIIEVSLKATATLSGAKATHNE